MELVLSYFYEFIITDFASLYFCARLHDYNSHDISIT